ncbi:hypothetical protein ACE939_11080 [Aquimarina sp. W85]|uniref:hypothetical protein n=1 Tax=Aquimarina rhodophyticola TaxID=3342246 RepID=UPI00366C175F
MDFYLDWHNNIEVGTSETLALTGETQVGKIQEITNNQSIVDEGKYLVFDYKFIEETTTI